MRNRNRRNNRHAVRVAPKAPAQRPTRTFTRTLRQTQSLTFDNVGISSAIIQGRIRADPRAYVDWEQAATPFEMFRVKRLRCFVIPTTLPSASFQTLLVNTTSTTIWTAPDYTADETVAGTNIKSYQNARFHTMGLNNFKKIVDTDVRLNSLQGGVLPPSTWLPTQTANVNGGWDPTVLNYTGFQLYCENNALFNVSPSLQAGLSLVLEIDIEFKQPGFATPPTVANMLPVFVVENPTAGFKSVVANESDTVDSDVSESEIDKLKKYNVDEFSKSSGDSSDK